MVVHGRQARLEEERQIDAGHDEDDERVQGNLAEQERPVIREDVAQRLADKGRAAGSLVEVADEAADHDRAP